MVTKRKKTATKKRTSVKDLPKTSKVLSAKHMKKVRGGITIGIIKGEDANKKHEREIGGP